MTSTTWPTTPASAAGALAARPATVACAPALGTAAGVPAPVFGARVTSARLRALTGAMPIGAGTATDEQHIQNKSTLGIHSPGRPLS